MKPAPRKVLIAVAAVTTLFLLFTAGPVSAAIFTYDPIEDPILSATFSADFAALVAHRTALDYEMNFVKLIDVTGSLGDCDLSDDFFGTAAWPNEPKVNMGSLETGIVSAQVAPWFFPALLGGRVGLSFRFTDTDDSMFAIDFLRLSIETASETVESYYGWPVGNENNGFGIGISDGGILPAPLPSSIPIGATGTGFDETISTKYEIPEPATIALLAAGLLAAMRLSKRRRLLLLTIILAAGREAQAISISDVNICQMDFYGIISPRVNDSNWGDFRFRVTPDDDLSDYYLSIWIREDCNSPAIWVIDNMMIPGSGSLDGPFDGARFFSLADVVESGTALDSIEYQMQLSTTPLGSTPSDGSWTSVNVTDGLYDVGDGLGVSPDPGRPYVPGPPPTPPFPLPIPEPNRIRSRFRPNVRDIEEEPNHCTPVGIARSLLWLHDTNAINLGLRADPNTLIAEFNEAAHWFGRPNTIRTDPCVPAWWVRLLQGKLKMTKDVNMVNKFAFHWLPGDVCTPDGNAIKRADWPTFEFVRNEVDANEDVEIMVDWLDVNNVIIGGHTMTIIGYTVDDSNNRRQVWVQDDPHQGRPDAKNDRRNTRFIDGVPPDLNDLHKNRVTMVVSESPKPKEIRQLHGYPLAGSFSPDVAVGSTGTLTAAVQGASFTPIAGVDVEFIKRAGDFEFTSGIILADGSETAIATNGDGIAEIKLKGQSPGPALIELAVTGAEGVSAYLLFDVIPCPLDADDDGDCDVDFVDYAGFAEAWLNGDWPAVKEFSADWLEGK